MKRLGAVVIFCVGVLLTGCQESQRDRNYRKLDSELVGTINNISVENAIIAQHTLYPYHFVPDGARLNELGERDFSVLARHFAEQTGSLNIRRGTTPAELYEARVTVVIESLKEAGIETSRVSMSDGMPGGSGMPSERVVTILQETPQE
ncbi:hypothetical protein ACFL5Z_06440 [Planctomycetota bacterium]